MEVWGELPNDIYIWSPDQLEKIARRKIFNWRKSLPIIHQDESFLSWYIRLCIGFQMIPSKVLNSEISFWRENYSKDLNLIEYGFSWFWMFSVKSLPMNFVWSLKQRGVEFEPGDYQVQTPDWMEILVSRFDTDSANNRMMIYALDLELSYCPRCWADNRYFKKEWRNPFQIVCLQHGNELIKYCENCKRILWPNGRLYKFQSNWFEECSNCKSKLQIENNDLDQIGKENIKSQVITLENLKDIYNDEEDYKRLWQNLQLNFRILGNISVNEKLRVLETLSDRFVNGLRNFYCIKTKKQFSKAQSFRSHAKLDEYSFVCNNCGKSNFVTENEFVDHAQICGSGLKCRKCKRTEFPLFSLYKNHINVCGKKRCLFCEEWVEGKRNYKRHLKDCGQSIQCDRCQKSGFNDYEEYSDHKISCKSVCRKCKTTFFATGEEFQNHIWKCGRKIMCKFCFEVGFKSKEEYLIHFRDCKSSGRRQTSLFEYF